MRVLNITSYFNSKLSVVNRCSTDDAHAGLSKASVMDERGIEQQSQVFTSGCLYIRSPSWSLLVTIHQYPSQALILEEKCQ